VAETSVHDREHLDLDHKLEIVSNDQQIVEGRFSWDNAGDNIGRR